VLDVCEFLQETLAPSVSLGLVIQLGQLAEQRSATLLDPRHRSLNTRKLASSGTQEGGTGEGWGSHGPLLAHRATGCLARGSQACA
jgi:hypothetical protein